jgi:hypothetical protein
LENVVPIPKNSSSFLPRKILPFAKKTPPTEGINVKDFIAFKSWENDTPTESKEYK